MPLSRCRCWPRLGVAKVCASALGSLALFLLLISRPTPTSVNHHNHRPPSVGKAASSDLWTGPAGWVVLRDNVTVHRGVEANPHNYTYLLDNPQICGDGVPDDGDRPSPPVLLVVLVASNARNGAERRQAIRDTWGQKSLQRALNFRVVFLLADPADPALAQDLVAENYAYGDLVQEDFAETFDNLALKSVMGLKWFVTRCPGAAFALKTDDDIFVHVPNLLSALDGHSMEDAILCHSNPVRRILRHGEGPLPSRYLKYCVPRDQLPGELFPRYCGGFAYAFSQSSARRLYQASQATPTFFIEDAYVTGFCRLKAGLRTLEHPGITLKPRVTLARASCAFTRESRITSHELGPRDMRLLWREVNTQAFFCPRLLGVIKAKGRTTR